MCNCVVCEYECGRKGEKIDPEYLRECVWVSACVRESYKTDKELCECVRAGCREIFKKYNVWNVFATCSNRVLRSHSHKRDSLLRKLERRINNWKTSRAKVRNEKEREKAGKRLREQKMGPGFFCPRMPVSENRNLDNHFELEKGLATTKYKTKKINIFDQLQLLIVLTFSFH